MMCLEVSRKPVHKI